MFIINYNSGVVPLIFYISCIYIFFLKGAAENRNRLFCLIIVINLVEIFREKKGKTKKKILLIEQLFANEL